MHRLQTRTPQPGVYNPYHARNAGAALCMANLRHYFEQWKATGAQVLLVGEALGYRGGRLTGIPFSSEKIVANHPRFGLANGYQVQATEGPYLSEATATLVHNALDQLQLEAACWNAFPFHPFPPRQPHKNRAPRTAELAWGGEVLKEVIALLSQPQVVAVGRLAHKTLTQLQMEHTAVRHPSYGGKADFEQGLAELRLTLD